LIFYGVINHLPLQKIFPMTFFGCIKVQKSARINALSSCDYLTFVYVTSSQFIHPQVKF